MEENDRLYAIINALDRNIEVPEAALKDMCRDKYSTCILKLLALHHNIGSSKVYTEGLKTPVDGKTIPNQLRVVGDILKAIGQIIDLPQAALSLAQFQFDKFIQICKSKNLETLERKAKGLYPQMNGKIIDRPLYVPYHDQAEEGTTIGNRKWEYSRITLDSWLNQAVNITQEEKMCYLVLLADTRLLDQCQRDWISLWAHLHVYYVQATLKPYRTFTVSPPPYVDSRTSEVEYDSLLKTITQFEHQFQLNSRAKGTYYLIASLLQQTRDIGESLKLFVNSFEYIPKKSWLETCFFYKLGLKYKTQFVCKTSRQNFDKEILHNPDQIEDYDYYMKIFLEDDEATQKFLKINQIPNYPGYQANSALIEKLAAHIQIASPIESIKALDLISDDTFVSKTLKLKHWEDSNFARKMIEKLKKNQEKYIKILENRLKIRGIGTDFQKYLDIWNLYHTSIERKAIDQIYSCIKLSDHHFSQQMSKITTLPFKNPNCAFLLLVNFATMLKQELTENKIQVLKLKKYKQLIQEDCFSEILRVLKPEKRDQFWSEWCQIWMRDEDLLSELLTQVEGMQIE